MERESFEDFEVAELLNEYFVSVKVDREERPDIDNIYMTICQALTGHGGWPLTIIMTPDQKPIFAGTYFPKKGSRGMMGLMELLGRIRKGWKNDRKTLVESADALVKSMDNHFTKDSSGGEISKESIAMAYEELESSFDDEYGGFFGYAPKFPTPHNLLFLLRYWKLTGEQRALDMVENTLVEMYNGGIFDHIGYGFSRYSTDEKWLVPHFEKMLYDNALLAMAYLEAYQATQKRKYAQIAEKIFAYISRDMTHSQGGFYSAEDADSEGVEGKFYVWYFHEILDILGEDNGEYFCGYYDITPEGNFEGRNIPNRIEKKGSVGEEEGRISVLRKKIFDEREKRVRPHKDDKILTAWNGLMIAAMAIGARVLENPGYAKTAERALDFILTNLTNEEGRLLARYRDGEAAYLAYVEDYAYIIWALIELYQTTFKAKYLEHALKFNEEMLFLFNDDENGGLFLYAKDGEQLIVRPKEGYDGALPSGNSVAALNMLRLARMTGDHLLEEKANVQLKAFAEQMNSQPLAHTHFLSAAMFALYPTKEIVLAGDGREAHMGEMIRIVQKSYLPQAVFMYNDTSLTNNPLERLVPYIKDQNPMGEKGVSAYICENYSCQAPITDIRELEQRLDEGSHFKAR